MKPRPPGINRVLKSAMIRKRQKLLIFYKSKGILSTYKLKFIKIV